MQETMPGARGQGTPWMDNGQDAPWKSQTE